MFIEIMSEPLYTIITINYNNAAGLAKTLASVNAQRCKEGFEQVVVDGASTDGSVEVMKKYDDGSVVRQMVSERDSGIYNAMNKGIRMARGRYVQFLNSGDYLSDTGVTERIIKALQEKDYPPILYGNMIKITKKGRYQRDKGLAGGEMTPWIMFSGALTHSAAFIERSLFDRFGPYNESFKIVSDWEWYYKVFYDSEIRPTYVDTDVVCFNLDGISETAHALNAAERRQVIEAVMPAPVLPDYDRFKRLAAAYGNLDHHPHAAALVRTLCKLLTYIDKITFRINSQKLKRELKRSEDNLVGRV